MKWIQVDTDTADDPRTKAVIKKFGNAGFGALVRLWLFVGRHGKRRPGWSLDSQGRPIDKSFLVEAAGMKEHEFDLLLSELARNGHVLKNQWANRRVLVFPAMYRRVDEYTRKRLRSMSGHAPDRVRQHNNTEQHNTKRYKNSAADAAPDPAKNYRVVLRLVHDVLDRTPAAVRLSPIEFASLKDDVKTACAKARIDYDADVVGRALESAIAQRSRKGAPA